MRSALAGALAAAAGTLGKVRVSLSFVASESC